MKKENKSNGVKAYVKDQIDDKSYDKLWFFICSVFLFSSTHAINVIGIGNLFNI